MNRVAGAIRTPDQRLRVFVSSTLKELAPERRAARAAIERLALAPVMFELGARPHPPRELYRAYLEQSDIFVGVYGEQYGWIAPGEEVSGLEDEWNLAPEIPKLIYLKRSEHREERLDELLERIRDDDDASYVTFTDVDELAALVTADLATLLAERFDAAGGRREPLAEPAAEVFSTEPVRPPSPLTRLVGRDVELATLTRMLADDGQRLVTITGPGGIGKSRLAVAAARDVETAFPDGVVFVDLAPVLDAGLVITAVANALGIRDTGDRPLAEKIAGALGRRRVLLVLDNVEQVVEAAPKLSALLAVSSASVLATSRILLRVRGEQNVPLGPLPSPEAAELFAERRARRQARLRAHRRQRGAGRRDLRSARQRPARPRARRRSAARAHAVRRSSNASTTRCPCSSEGRATSPNASAPLRATIDWSAQLLSEPERDLLLRLGVFRAGFGLDAVEWMADGLRRRGRRRGARSAGRREPRARAGSRFAGLVHDARPRCASTAGTCSPSAGSWPSRRQRHADFYVGLATAADAVATWQGQVARVTRLLDEHDELRAAVDHLFATRRFDDVAELVWPLYSFWWGGGRAGELRAWMTRLLEPDVELSERSTVIIEYCLNAIRYWRTSDESVDPGHGPAASTTSVGWATGAARPSRARHSPSPSSRTCRPTSTAAEENSQRSLDLAERVRRRVRWCDGRGHARPGPARAGPGRRRRRAVRDEPGGGARHPRHARTGDRAQPPRVGPRGRRRARTELASASASSCSSPPPSVTRRASPMRSRGCSRSRRPLATSSAPVGCSARPRTSESARALPTRSPLSFFEPFLERVLAGPEASRFEAARRLGRDAELADVVEAALG